MREIALDTETTGLEPERGDRIVEIGAVELFNHMPTGRTFHVYINPERGMPHEAFRIHGIGPDLLDPPQQPTPGQVTLRDKPVFAAVGQRFLDFIGEDARLVIHNAAFDIRFLNAELRAMNLPPVAPERAVDTLAMARSRFPGAQHSLDALCRRFGIDNSHRTLHGALLDSEILAEVYLELIGGRQPDFGLAPAQDAPKAGQMAETADWRPYPRPQPLPPHLTAEEEKAHRLFIEAMGPSALWHRFG